MKTFTSAAVFGLVPVPPMPDADACSDSDNRSVTAEDVHASQLVCPQRNAAERLATKDELACIRREWAALAAGARLADAGSQGRDSP
jgi:hypothetical protein